MLYTYTQSMAHFQFIKLWRLLCVRVCLHASLCGLHEYININNICASQMRYLAPCVSLCMFNYLCTLSVWVSDLFVCRSCHACMQNSVCVCVCICMSYFLCASLSWCIYCVCACYERGEQEPVVPRPSVSLWGGGVVMVLLLRPAPRWLMIPRSRPPTTDHPTERAQTPMHTTPIFVYTLQFIF